jgi:predicted transcriptional regulator
MYDLVFVDTLFDQNKSKEYNLSIQLGLDGFSFSILDKNNTCLALSKHEIFKKDSDNKSLHSFKDHLRHNEILNLKFANISVLWISKKSTLIPGEFFNEKLAYESFQLCHSFDEDDQVLWNKINELDAYNLYSIPKGFTEELKMQFSDMEIYHHTYPFYKDALSRKFIENHPTVFINIQRNFFHVIIPDRQKKHYINSFSYQADSDLAYYILNIYKQQKLNNERSKLILDGLIQDESKIIDLLKKYLANIEVKLLPSNLRVKGNIPLKEYNQFNNLLNLTRCV